MLCVTVYSADRRRKWVDAVEKVAGAPVDCTKWRISESERPKVLEDAERLIAAWNERQAKRMPILFSPTIGAAMAASVRGGPFCLRQPAIVWLDTSSTSHITSTLRPASWLFARPTTRQWEKLPCRISASDRDGRSDPIARCAHCYSTIAERRSDSTTGCGRALL